MNTLKKHPLVDIWGATDGLCLFNGGAFTFLYACRYSPIYSRIQSSHSMLVAFWRGSERKRGYRLSYIVVLLRMVPFPWYSTMLYTHDYGAFPMRYYRRFSLGTQAFRYGKNCTLSLCDRCENALVKMIS